MSETDQIPRPITIVRRDGEPVGPVELARLGGRQLASRLERGALRFRFMSPAEVRAASKVGARSRRKWSAADDAILLAADTPERRDAAAVELGRSLVALEDRQRRLRRKAERAASVAAERAEAAEAERAAAAQAANRARKAAESADQAARLADADRQAAEQIARERGAAATPSPAERDAARARDAEAAERADAERAEQDAADQADRDEHARKVAAQRERDLEAAAVEAGGMEGSRPARELVRR